MRNSVCFNCRKRTVPKTCESTCPERQAEIRHLEEVRHQRYLDGIENDSVRLRRIRQKDAKDRKAGRH